MSQNGRRRMAGMAYSPRDPWQGSFYGVFNFFFGSSIFITNSLTNCSGHRYRSSRTRSARAFAGGLLHR